jgi:hypothetical protein
MKAGLSVIGNLMNLVVELRALEMRCLYLPRYGERMSEGKWTSVSKLSKSLAWLITHTHRAPSELSRI